MAKRLCELAQEYLGDEIYVFFVWYSEKKRKNKKVRDPLSFCSQKFFENILKEYKLSKKRIEHKEWSFQKLKSDFRFGFFIIFLFPEQWSCKPDTNRSENRSLQYS